MKYMITLLLLMFSVNSFSQLATPRETFQTFLKSMVKIKNDEGIKSENYKKAISTLELDLGTKSLEFEIGKRYTEQLIQTLDRMKKVVYAEITEDPKKNKWFFDQHSYKGHLLEISLVKRNNKWLFSKETLASLDYYLSELKGREVIEGLTQLETLGEKIKKKFPKSLHQPFFFLQGWQWVSLLTILIFAFIVEKIFLALCHFVLTHYVKFIKENSDEKLPLTIAPLGKILFLFLILSSISLLNFSVPFLAFSKRLLYILMACCSMWLGHRVVSLLSFYAQRKALETESRFDDIVVPLATKTAFVLIYIFGIILIASSLTINVTSLIAGLGIGGLAFAFAAKDTLANFFGSIMLVLDRPFDIGDVITAGDVTGEVTEVGFRSTRIRSFDDSVITISNGELMNRPIDNMGKRRFRRLKTTLGLEYDTPAEKIESFCEGVRQLILGYTWTKKDSFHVYFSGFGASSLDIMLVVYWKTNDYAREQSEKHRLLIDILRLAKEIKVDFAFPTQTLHMFTENKTEQVELTSEYLDEGIEKAKSLVSKPLSLKNPRSNSENKDQFGSNDIGI